MHFIMDAYDTIEESTNNLMSINECLVKVADALRLKSVMPPFLVPYYYSKRIEDGGISAFMIFEDGHITIHTFPKRRCYFADIMSDANFSVAEAEKELLSFFHSKAVHTYSFDRRTTQRIFTSDYNSSVDFGPHYLITVQNVEMTFEYIYKWLDCIAPKINMVEISRPYVIYSTVKDPKYISGVLMVAQSHVAVHYNILEKLAYIDIFSCSFLENDQIEKLLVDSFGAKSTYQLIVRGNKHESFNQINSNCSDVFGLWKNNKYC